MLLSSTRMQLYLTVLATASSASFWVSWLNLMFLSVAGGLSAYAPLEPAFGESFLKGIPVYEAHEEGTNYSWQRLYVVSVGFLFVSVFLDSISNDICAHYLACSVYDDSLAFAKQIKIERATRAAKELQEHDIACRVMRAGPTSSARCVELGAREDRARAAVGTAEEAEAFAALQLLVQAEMRRIHRLYYCCLLRCMVMPTRFAYLRDVRSTKGSTPRQPIPSHIRPENNGDIEYLAWLFGEIQPLQDTFSKQISAMVSKLNRAVWPSDVGLSSEQFPYKIWRGEARSKLHEDEGLYMGAILTQRARVTSAEVSAMEVKERAAAKVRALRARILRKAATQHVFVTGMERDVIEVQASGKLDRQVVDPANLRASRGAGVLIPGPLKREQRCRDKITTDYEGKDAWPAAASLVDIVRCCIAFDDPYAMAVMVALLQKEFDVVRVKNRFENDEVVEVSTEMMQAEFYAAETSGTDSTEESATNSEKMYRDVNLNLRPKGSQFVVEVQLTLTGISILKKSEQKIYTLARMASAEELLGTSVFSKPHEFVVPISKSISGPPG